MNVRRSRALLKGLLALDLVVTGAVLYVVLAPWRACPSANEYCQITDPSFSFWALITLLVGGAIAITLVLLLVTRSE